SVMPAGSVPLTMVNTGAGNPPPARVGVPGPPRVSWRGPPEPVSTTGGSATVSVNGCEAESMLLLATITTSYAPPSPASGVPDSVAVPSQASRKATPSGSAPDRVSDGAGNPAVVIAKVAASPTVNVAAAAL